MSACERYAKWLRFWYIRAGVPTVLSRTMVGLLPHPGMCARQVLGVTLPLDVRDLLQANILLDGVWSPELSRWWVHFAREATTIFDVGAHLGYFALLGRGAAGEGASVHAFEPNPRMQAQFEQGVALNGFDGMHVVPQAVSDGPGEVTLYIREAFEPGASSTLDGAPHDTALTVPTITLDAYCDAHGIETVDLLKMDIEGAEVRALRGMEAGFAVGRYKVMVLDIHNALLEPLQVAHINHTLREAGFTLYSIGMERCERINSTEALPDETLAIHESRLAAAAVLHLPAEVAARFAGRPEHTL